MDRRQYIVAVGAIVISGCLGDNDSSDNGGSDESAEDDSNEDNSGDGSGSEGGDVTPTGEADIRVVDIRPDSVSIGESFQYTIEFRNEGNDTGQREVTIYTAVTAGPEPASGDWESYEEIMRVDAGETRTLESGTGTFHRPSVFYIGVDDPTIDHEIHIPNSKMPRLVDGALVTDWQTFGDLEDNQVTSASTGDIITIAYRYWYWAVDRRLSVFRDVAVFDSAGDRVDIRTQESEQLTDSSGWQQFEVGTPFDTRGWDPGTYTAEIQLEDRDSGGVSDIFEVEFESE